MRWPRKWEGLLHLGIFLAAAGLYFRSVLLQSIGGWIVVALLVRVVVTVGVNIWRDKRR